MPTSHQTYSLGKFKLSINLKLEILSVKQVSFSCEAFDYYEVFIFQDKVRNFFLIESRNEETVLRTKRCLFAVTEDEENERRQREEEEDGEFIFQSLSTIILMFLSSLFSSF